MDLISSTVTRTNVALVARAGIKFNEAPIPTACCKLEVAGKYAAVALLYEPMTMTKVS